MSWSCFVFFEHYLIDLGFLLNAHCDISRQQIPLSHVPEDVYKISVDWLNQRSFDALGSFVLWSLDSILADLASHQGTGKSSKKVVQQASSKSQVTSSHFSLYTCFMHTWCWFICKWWNLLRFVELDTCFTFWYGKSASRGQLQNKRFWLLVEFSLLW